ncbi:MAG: GH92 family glycosyl hydrolase [Flavobacteriaceae bacterium]
MKTPKILSYILVLLCLSCLKNSDDKPLTVYVNPLIGTGAHGHTFPGATTPFGMVQLSPDTRTGNWDACSGYHYSDSSIIGFSHTHLTGTGCIDLGDLLIRPTTKSLLNLLDPEGNKLIPTAFDRNTEFSEPGYYRVILEEEEITCELTTTKRTGIHRYSFLKHSEPRLIFDLSHQLEKESRNLQITSISETEISGYRFSTGWSPDQKLYFVARFSQPMKEAKIWTSGEQITTVFPYASDDIRIECVWPTLDNNTLEVHMGISGVSVEGARKNLDSETSAFGFNQYRQAASKVWNKELEALQITTDIQKEKEIFYTAVYHSLIAPITISDVDGNYRGVDGKIHNDKENNHYTSLSFWDTFRAWNPMMTLRDEKMVNELVNSMLDFYVQKGELPIWPLWGGETETMIGYHAVSVINDAWQKGIRGYDAELALEAMIASSNTKRKGNDLYRNIGFIPANLKKESVSCLLEYAYDDWCIYKMAKDLGKKEIAEEYKTRALNYQNNFDGHTKFFRGKKDDGNWVMPFDSYEVSRDMTEATAWQYRFFVPYDTNGLVNLFGSNEGLIEALDELFNAKDQVKGHLSDITGLIGQYAHGNEPSHHIAYLYSYLGQPWKTQYYVNKIQNEMYDNTPAGIIGNEDCGQMSAWHIMSSLGFYPVCPGSNEYVLTTPRFKKTVFKLGNGKQLKIVADKDPKDNPYIQSVELNGKTLNSTFIVHKQIMEGGNLSFTLSKEPQKELTLESPYSMTSKSKVSVPYLINDVGFFLDSTQVEMGVATHGATIYFTTDGSEPNQQSSSYDTLFGIKEDQIIKMKAYKEGMEPSITSTVRAKKIKLLPAKNSPIDQNGIYYKYFEGKFSSVLDLKTSQPIKEGWIDNFSLREATIEDHFGFMFRCKIQIPKDGVYRFFTNSDDGSVLWVDGHKVVNNDGGHAAIKNFGVLGLKKGIHELEVYYFEDYEGQSLEVGMGILGEEAIKFQPVQLWR